MTLTLIKLAAISSIFLLVVSVGLQARPRSTFRVFLDPADRRRTLGALCAMFVATPLLAYVLVRVIAPGQTAGAALLAISLAPMAPFLPRKQLKSGGDPDWVIALQVAATVLSIVLAPVYLSVLSSLFGLEIADPVSDMMQVLGLTVFAPLLVGMAVNVAAPDLAARLAAPLGLLGTAMLAAVVVLVLALLWPALLAAAMTPALPACLALAVGGVVFAHVLAGNSPTDRVSAAMAAVSRHPGVALVIAGAALGPPRPDLLATVLLFVIVGTGVLAVYQRIVRPTA